MASDVKMVIVANVAANMSIGRLTAQCCHAATYALVDTGKWINEDTFQIDTSKNSILQYWMRENSTKVVVKVWGYKPLLELKKKAEDAKIQASLVIEDDDQITALALGPDISEKLDPLTKDLTLL